ncbi:cytochrome c biogenesis protein ResB [Coriobacteriia bacterium Es71-Z0120]|uniref:cytochrome c biogenesis protein ResB n=1 Tax=Parvivirga hydrogeniphila TaxID=2939460 RepID=UPI00226102E9|nr:cytochrome c biogenesis protein ResB [Parvivirga hydrogeniphila]MCL4079187.1 cytochrome c biogenesis protein ResB [Parvivirga hydrogeniphila]
MTGIMRYVGSRRFAAFLLVVWIVLLLVWIVPFQAYGLPEPQIRAIVYGEPFFRVLYALLAANMVACIAVHTGTALARVRRTPSDSERPAVLGGVPLRDAPSVGAEQVQRVFAAVGFRRPVAGDGWVWAVKNRFSPLGTVVFHAGLVVLLSGVTAGVLWPNLRFQGNLVLAEGETFGGAESAYIDRSSESSASPPTLSFQVESVRPRFYEDMLLFTSLEAEVRENGRLHAVSVSRPWFPRLDTSVSLSDFGYALEVVARGDDGSAPVRSVYKLKAFPSGQRDTIEISVGADRYRVYVQVYGDYIDRNGKPGVQSFNSDDPRLVVSVARVLTGGAGERVLADEQLVRIGEPVEVPRLTLEFPGLRHYGVFRVVRDPVAPVVAIAVVLVVVGVALRLAFPRTEALFVADGASGRVSVRSDFYGTRLDVAERIVRRLERSWR